jgi:hypothetical protein
MQETDDAVAAEVNDDDQLCRFEFLEVLTRIACAKYRRGKHGYQGPCTTVACALQLFIEEHVLKISDTINDSEFATTVVLLLLLLPLLLLLLR